MSRVLFQVQLSNYDTRGRYILECDSNFQLTVGRTREWLKNDPELLVDILVPMDDQTLTSPESLTKGIPGFDRVTFLRQRLSDHAIKTRYDFHFRHMETVLRLYASQYTHVYINDPMLFRHFKAVFFMCFKSKPKFIVQNHFIDEPKCPKFPTDVSMWHGQVEAALRADVNVFFGEQLKQDLLGSMEEHYSTSAIEQVRQKTLVWKGCYSTTEINTPVDMTDLRFDPNHEVFDGSKIVVLVPNRVGGMGRSSDYTNAGHFLFEVANKVYEQRQDFVVIAGNPNQKFSNEELGQLCKPLVNLVPDTFRRNEFRFIGSRAHINVGLYNQDTHGGTAWRECIDLGTLPLSNDMHEYKHFFDMVNYPFRVKNDLSNCAEVFNDLLDYIKSGRDWETQRDLRAAVVGECSYENSAAQNMRDLGLL
jgi:hypothetical protein